MYVYPKFTQHEKIMNFSIVIKTYKVCEKKLDILQGSNPQK